MALLSTIAIGVVYAAPTDPTGPQNITISPSSRFDTGNYPAMTLYAEAGNLTQLTITSLSQTQTWQGYYGEISGMFFDGLGTQYYHWDTPEMVNWMRKLQPGIMITKLCKLHLIIISIIIRVILFLSNQDKE